MAPPLVVHILPVDLFRGAQTYARELRCRLDGPEARHRTLTLYHASAGALRPDYELGLASGRLRRLGADPRAVLALRRFVRREQPDLVVAHGGEPLKYAVLAGVPRRRLVYYKIGVGGARLRGGRRGLNRRLLGRARLVAAVSDDAAREAHDLGVPNSQLRVIVNGRDPAVYRPAPRAAGGAGPDNAVRLAFVGHLTPSKRPERFVELVRVLRADGVELHATMGGDGPLQLGLAAAARDAGVDLVGRVDDVPALLAASDVFVFTSVPEGEGMPGVLIEAGLAGLPVVTTDVPGARSVVDEGRTGFVVAVDDFDALVRRDAPARRRRRTARTARPRGAQPLRSALQPGREHRAMARGLRTIARRAVRVLYLIDSLIAGGAERSLAALAPHYARLGVELEVGYFYERDNVWLPAVEAAGARTLSIAGPGGRVARARRAGRLIRRRRPELVHTTLFEADIAGRLGALGTRVPVVCSLVNAAYGPEQLADPALRAWKVRGAQLLDAVTARRVARFHAVSESIADVMGERLHVPRRRIDVIARGRDPEELGRRSAPRRAAAREGLGIATDSPVVVAIGRHEYQKGFDVLIDAFAEVQAVYTDARLVIAGRTGAVTPDLTARVDRLGVRDSVDFLGFRADVAELLCAADVFVSASRWEGSPGAVIEAMALEVPIVATGIPATLEVFGPATCAEVVAPDDAHALGEAIRSALRDRGAGGRTAAARQRFVERFTIDRVARQMVDFYARSLDPGAG